MATLTEEQKAQRAATRAKNRKEKAENAARHWEKGKELESQGYIAVSFWHLHGGLIGSAWLRDVPKKDDWLFLLIGKKYKSFKVGYIERRIVLADEEVEFLGSDRIMVKVVPGI